MKLSNEELKEAISKKSDEELYDILYVHRSDYTTETIELAREQFRAREIKEPMLADFADAGSRAIEQEDAPLNWPLKMCAFLFSTVFLGIPAMLAHRRYIDAGNKRKAREWARWALFGLAFYLTLGFMAGMLANLIR